MALDGLHRLADAIKKTPEAIATEAKINDVLEKLKKLQDTVVTDDELKQIKEDLKDAYLKASISAKNAIDDALLAIKKEKDATAKAIKADIQESADNVTLAYMDLEASYETTKKETQMMMEEKLTAFGEFAGEKINAAAQFIGTKTKEAINGALDYVASKISMISTNLSALTGAVKAGFNKLKGWIMNPIEKLKALPGQIIAGIGTLLNKVKQAVVWTVKAAYSLIVGAVKYTMLAAVKVLKFAIWAVGKAVQFGFYLMKQAFAFMFKIVSKVFSFVVGVMWGAIKAMGKFLLTFVWESLKVIGKTVLKIGAFIFKMVIQIFTSMLASALGPIILLLGGILLFVLIASGKLKGLWDGLLEFLGFGGAKDMNGNPKPNSGLVKWIGEWWDRIWIGALDLTKGFGGWLLKWWDKIWTSATTITGSVYNFFKNYVIDPIYNFFATLFNKTSDIGVKFWNMLKDFGNWLARTIIGEDVSKAIARLEENKSEKEKEKQFIEDSLKQSEEDIAKIRADFKAVDLNDPEYEKKQKEARSKLEEIWRNQDAMKSNLKKIPRQIDAINSEITEAQKIKDEGGDVIPGWFQSIIGGKYKHLTISGTISMFMLGNKDWVFGDIKPDSLLGKVKEYFQIAYVWIKENIWEPMYAFLTKMLFKITTGLVSGINYLVTKISSLLRTVFSAIGQDEVAASISRASVGVAGFGAGAVSATREIMLDAEEDVFKTKQARAYEAVARRTSEPGFAERIASLPEQERSAEIKKIQDEEGVSGEDFGKKQLMPIINYGLNKLFLSRVVQQGILNKSISIQGYNDLIEATHGKLAVIGATPDKYALRPISSFYQMPTGDAKNPDINGITDSLNALRKLNPDAYGNYANLFEVVKADGDFIQKSENIWNKPYEEDGLFGKETKNREGTFVGNLIEQKDDKYNPSWLNRNLDWMLPVGAALAAVLITLGTAGFGAPIAGSLLAAAVSAGATGASVGWQADKAIRSTQLVSALTNHFQSSEEDLFMGVAPFAMGGIIRPPSANSDMGRIITVAEAGDPEIVVPLNAQGLQYIQEVSERIQPVESSGAIRTNNDDILAAVLMLSDKITDKPVKKPFMASTNTQRSNNEKSDLLKMVSTGILTK